MKILCFLYFITLPALLASQRPPSRTPYLGTGYDLKVGNPEGNSLFTNENDPGLKPTRSIILDDQLCPFGSTCLSLLNNSMVREYLTDDMIKYYRQIQDRWTNIDEDEADHSPSKSVLRVGGNCKALAEAKILLTELKSAMVTKEISKIYVNARIDYKYNFTLNPQFVKSVCNLPKNLTEETRRDFTNLFKTWGTHVITEVSLGEKEIERKFYEEGEYFGVLNEIVHAKQATTISSNYDPKFIPDILEEMANIPAYKNINNLKFGSKEIPVPIRMHLEPIYNILSPGICDLSNENSIILKETVQDAMKDYLIPGTKIEPEFVTRDYSDFTKWPQGTFSLPKSIHGCPKGWKYGIRHHDTDNTTPYRTAFGDNWKKFIQERTSMEEFNFEFCSQTQKSQSSRKWGKGNYCIFRYGRTCPSGFNDAQIFMDDEDSNNGNSVNGTLPDGLYNKDTMYYLCCRKDGDGSYLVLPTTSPFVLLPLYGHGCQKVFGMKVTSTLIEVDGGGSSLTSTCTGSAITPACNSQAQNVLRIHFCYYE